MRKSKKATWRVMVTTWCDRLIQEEFGDQADDDSMSDNDKAGKLGGIRFLDHFRIIDIFAIASNAQYFGCFCFEHSLC